MRLALLTLCAVSAFGQDSVANLIQSGNRKAALDRIRTGADVNAPQPDGTRALHWAVYKIDYELVDTLLAKKAAVNVKNEFGSAPLAEAVKLADLRMVKALLDAGAEPEAENEDGQTALMLAAKGGSVSVSEMLLKAGAKVNAIEKFRKQTALMWASTAPKNAGPMVKLLLANGADVKPRALYTDWPAQITSEPRAQYRPVGGLTALLYAVRDGCYECVEALLAAGANIDTPTPEAVTPLMMAIDNEHYDVAKLLLAQGANPHVWDWWGRTALYIAVDRKAAAMGGGNNPLPAGGRGGRGAVDLSGVSSLITTLLNSEVDSNPQLNMHRPSRGSNSGRFSDTLLSTGSTPLFRAAMVNDTELVKALLEKGANPNVVDMGITPFLTAAGIGQAGRGAAGPANTAMLELMLQRGANINAQVTGTKTYTMRVSRSPSPNEGMTALHVAAQTGRVDLVRFLLEKGANPNIQDSNGKKPIDLLPTAAAPTGGRGGQAPGGRGAGPAVNPAAVAEIRTLLQAASSK